MANDFKENLSRGIAALETKLYGHCEEVEKVMAGYNPSSFCSGFLYALTLVKGLLTQMPDAVEIPDCKKCAFNYTIAWHQCEHCLGEARNNFAPKEEANHGR